MPIRVLPTLVVNQIAAGEVVERPASVVKELVENAVDAGATRIEVEIEEGGRTLVRVTDDGAGIPFDELPLAVAPHATSKIERADDLAAIATMGFRGEALASIASVSRFAIRSRRRDAHEAGLLEGEGDRFEAPRPVAGPPGTSVSVRHLFFNVPARRKFLKSDQAEATRIGETVRDLALAHPSIGFVLRVDGRTRLDLAPADAPRHRVLDLLGRELEAELMEAAGGDGPLRAWGLVGPPTMGKPTSRSLRVLLNGRCIADRTIQHAVREAYRGLMEPNRWPTAVLYLAVDPALVDVNVHPAKAEVRFRDSGAVHRVVHRAVEGALRAADLVPALDLGRAERPGATVDTFPVRPAGGATSGGGWSGSPARPGSSSGAAGFDYARAKALLEAMPASAGADAIAAPAPAGLDDAPAALPTVRHAIDALQVHGMFIVTQDEHGLVVIDQHALHERVMFEKLRERVERGALESQRLLVPATFPADADQLEALEQLRPLLARLGIDAEPIGPRAIAVYAYPTLLLERRCPPVDFMPDLLRRASDDGRFDEPEQAIFEVLDMMACKAAIKAGDRLSREEIDELLRLRETVERSTNCPHGRPTSLRITIRDLERQFGR